MSGVEKEYSEESNTVETGLKEVEHKTLSLHDEVTKPGKRVYTDEHLDTIAAACHMANRAYCIGIGDTSQPLWEDAPDWQKSSAKNGVKAKLDNPGVTPQQSHEGWLAEKAAAGWKYGAVKDPDKKEHPCFVPYDQLDAAAKAKDDIFLATVISMSKALGIA